jgi:ABC-type nitrate/sulfonate/bicarbonate transport system substrate-binding protein
MRANLVEREGGEASSPTEVDSLVEQFENPAVRRFQAPQNAPFVFRGRGETMKKAIVACLGAALIVFASYRPATAQASVEKFERLRLLYSAVGGSQAAIWVPYEAKIFRKHGLDVELLYVGGGGRAAQVVQSGEVPIGIFTGGAVVNSNLAGGDLVIVASAMNAMTFSVVARPEIRRPEELQGKRVGISRFGSATDFGLRYLEERWPVKRQRHFAVLQMGGMPENWAALRSGALDAAVLNAELTILAKKEGFRELADLSQMGLSFPTSSICTTRWFIRRNENAVRKFVRAYAEGVHFAKTQRAFTVEVMKKYLRNEDTAFVNSLYDLYILQNIPRIPRPSAEAVRTVLDQMAETNPQVAKLQPEQFIDARFFQELEKESFLQKLWK